MDTKPHENDPAAWLTALLEKTDLYLILLLLGLVVGLFLPAIQNDFIGYDDPLYVTSNPYVQKGLTAHTLAWAFSTGQGGNWNPVTWLSHFLDVEFFGLQAWGHHLTSILLHAVNTALLFTILRKITNARWRSLAVAALFGLHPLRVESVVWVAERKDVLCGLFWMLTIWAYSSYAVRKKQVEDLKTGGRAKRFYFLTVLFFALALMSKPMVVTLPLVLLLLDLWPLQRWTPGRLKYLVLEKLPLLLLSLVGSIITLLVQSSAGAIVSETSLLTRIGNVPVSYCRYLGKILWPSELAAFYPPVNWNFVVALLAFLLLFAISLAAFFQRANRPWLLVGWSWFLMTLLPVIGIVQAGEQSIADRYSYLPSIGIGLILIWAGFEIFHDRRVKQPAFARLGLAAFALLLMLSAVITRTQIGYWKDTKTLFQYAAQVTRNNYLAHNNIGVALEKEGAFQGAISQFEKALRAKPNYAEAYNNLGVALGKLGRFDSAINQFRTALRFKPNYAEPHKNLGTILDQLGHTLEAIQEYQIALRIQPNDPDAHNNLGAAYGRSGRATDAILEFQKVLQLQPDSADAHNNLGVALDARGNLDEAIQHFQRAVKLNPEYARAHFNLGGALSRKGKLDAAVVEFREALRLKPDYGAAQTNLDLVLEMKAKMRSSQ
jgi:protein O-mannosyl-transferase